MESGKNKIKILVVLRWLGGIRSFCRYVYNNFDPNRFEYTFLAPDVPEMQYLLEDMRKLNVHFIPIKCNPAHAKLDFKVVCRTILGGKYDFIHSQGFTAGAYCAIPSFLKRIPHLLTLHEVFTDGQFRGWKGILKKGFVKLIIHLFDGVHCVSRSAADNIYNYIPSLKRKNNIFVVPNGIEVSRFLNPEKRDLKKELSLRGDVYLIGYFGRFMSPKGFIFLIEALELLLRDYTTKKKPMVVAVNDGGFLNAEKRRISEKGLENHVIFLPFESNPAPTIKGMDVIVMPSLWEAGPLLVMEILVSGVPFIGTDIPPIKEILSDTPGKMVPPRDPHSLANAIYLEMMHPSYEMAKAFTNAAEERFDVRIQANRLQEIIFKLVEFK